MSLLTCYGRHEMFIYKQTFHPSNPEGSQEHTSLITNSFLMILLSLSNSSLKSTLFDMFLFYDWPFLHVFNVHEKVLFSL